MHSREILFTPRCSPRGTEFPRSSAFLYDVRLRSYGASNLSNFRILAYFPNTKPLKRTFRWPAYSPGVTSQNDSDSDFSMWWSKVQQGAFRDWTQTGDFLRILLGELGTPKLAQIFAYGKWLYPYIMLLHGTSYLDQRCLKKCNSEDGCTFPQNIFTPAPKITPKPNFGWPFNAKPIIQSALRQSHVNGATTLKLYDYIRIGKYLGYVKIFPLTGVWGAQGPLM